MADDVTLSEAIKAFDDWMDYPQGDPSASALWSDVKRAAADEHRELVTLSQVARARRRAGQLDLLTDAL
jgi:hypothetical protein